MLAITPKDSMAEDQLNDRATIQLLYDKQWDKFSAMMDEGKWDANQEIVITYLDNRVERIPLLPMAIGDNATALAIKLIGAGANVNKRYEGSTPLIEAVEKGNLELVEALLKAGAKVDAVTGKAEDCSYMTALMFAAEVGNLAMVERLIEAGADVSILTKHKKQSAIWCATAFQFKPSTLQVVRRLFAAGCRLLGNELHCPVDRDDVESVKMLLELGCPVDEPLGHNEQDGPRRGDRPLSVAVGGLIFCTDSSKLAKKLETIKILLSAKANPNAPNGRGVMPLRIAVACEELPVAELLLSAGADPYLACNSQFNSAFDLATERNLESFLRLFGALPKSAV